MGFIKQNVKLADKTEALLQALMGHLQLTFTEGKVHVLLPDVEVKIEGEKYPMTGFNETLDYTVLYTSEQVIVVSGAEPVTGQKVVTTYNFDGPDVMWVYTGGSDRALPHSHYREYFRRQPSDK